jgi:xylulokinase
MPLDYVGGGEVGPALGAARLAQIAVDGGAPADICRRPAVIRTLEPDRALIARLAAKKSFFRRAYPAIASLKGT